jgi:hypothetical protein
MLLGLFWQSYSSRYPRLAIHWLCLSPNVEVKFSAFPHHCLSKKFLIHQNRTTKDFSDWVQAWWWHHWVVHTRLTRHNDSTSSPDFLFYICPSFLEMNVKWNGIDEEDGDDQRNGQRCEWVLHPGILLLPHNHHLLRSSEPFSFWDFPGSRLFQGVITRTALSVGAHSSVNSQKDLRAAHIIDMNMSDFLIQTYYEHVFTGVHDKRDVVRLRCLSVIVTFIPLGGCGRRRAAGCVCLTVNCREVATVTCWRQIAWNEHAEAGRDAPNRGLWRH